MKTKNTFFRAEPKMICFLTPQQLFSIALFLLLSHSAAAQQHLSTTDKAVHLQGLVVDASTNLPIPFANVVIDGQALGAATDIEGRFHFHLSPATYTIKASAIGYEPGQITSAITSTTARTISIGLQPTILMMEEVLVSEQSNQSGDIAAPQQKLNATEDLMQRVSGVNLIQRANFAWEPAIRGMSGGQVGLVIDGMKVYGACVDKMDPASSYIEPENLEKLEISKGGFDLTQSSQIGGAVNLVTEKPDFMRPYELAAETGFESVATLRRARIAGGASAGRFAARGSFSYRKADDFAPGGQDAIAYSGFEKRNYKFSLATQLGEHQRITASFLGDDAWNIGYPVLLMDASLAQARLYSLMHEMHHIAAWLDRVETRLYHNRVDHWMDDRNRDVMEREVMRGMYMPMYGNTETWGGIGKVAMHHKKNQLNLTLDAHQVKQFGDMWMYSLFPNIQDMYLLNMGDVVALNTAATLDFRRPLSDRLNLRTNMRVDLSWRDVKRDELVSIFKARYTLEGLARRYELFSGSATLEYALKPNTKLRLALARAARLPTNTENYGHYVYNYVDGYFYTGNPDLASEKSRQIEIGLDHITKRLGLRLTAFYNSLQDYIIGISDPGIDVGLGGRTSVYRFRVYANTDKAYLVGGEASALLSLTPAWEVAASLSYTQGHNISLKEPLPMMPPLSGFVSLRYRKDKTWATLDSRWAIAQNRVSAVADEDVTDGFNILSFRSGYKLGQGVELKAGMENILDSFYHEHLSIGNLPGRGRNIFAAVSYTL